MHPVAPTYDQAYWVVTPAVMAVDEAQYNLITGVPEDPAGITFSRTEVAKLFGVYKGTVTRWVGKGDLSEAIGGNITGESVLKLHAKRNEKANASGLDVDVYKALLAKKQAAGPPNRAT